MKSLSIQEARKNLSNIITQVNETNEPMLIIGNKSNAVLVSDEAWNGIHETLYLMSIPGMRESILDGMKTPFSTCNEYISCNE